MEKEISLSPSTIGIFKNCPRCFWLHINRGHKRPRGIFPSLPGGMDLVIKKYFDNFRSKLPPELEGKVRGVLFENMVKLKLWRNWRTSLRFRKDNATLSGALDDLLLDGKIYIPLDYKTRGSSPKDDTNSYYQHQLDIYGLLLERNGYKTDKVAYLIYYYPQKVSQFGRVDFEVEPKKIEINIEQGERLFDEAVKLLRAPLPKSHQECEYCTYARFFEGGLA